jgi:hypothetical protein
MAGEVNSQDFSVWRKLKYGNSRDRRRAGIEAAKMRGVYKGRTATPKNTKAARARSLRRAVSALGRRLKLYALAVGPRFATSVQTEAAFRSRSFQENRGYRGSL